MPIDYALSCYPLSEDYRKSLEASIGVRPIYLSLSELRQLPFLQMVKKLRAMNADRLFLPLEDETSKMIVPILEMMASISKAKSIEFVQPDLSRNRFSRWRTPRALSSFLAACCDGQRVLHLCNRDTQRLVSLPIQSVALPNNRNVLYLKTNLMLGVKAGGSVGHVAGVVNEMMRDNYKVHLVSAERPVAIDSSVEWHRVPLMRSFAIPYEVNQFRYNMCVIKDSLEWILDFPISFIYQRMSIANYSGVMLARRKQIPLVVEYNGSEVWVANNWGYKMRYHALAQSAEDVSLKHAHVIVTVSNVLRDELVARGVHADRVVVYPNCVDPLVFNPDNFSAEASQTLRQQRGIHGNAVVVAFIGTFGPWHGIEVLARAIRFLVDNESAWLQQQNVHFLIVGDGIRMPQVKEILGEGLCMPFVTLTGLIAQKDAPRFLAASDIVVSPHVPNSDGSRFFGSPTKLFEYMAMAKGIVASDLEQIGEILKNSLKADALPRHAPAADINSLAILCRPNDKDSLIRGIKFLVENSAWCHRLGENARKETLEKYTWAHHCKAIFSRLHAVAKPLT